MKGEKKEIWMHLCEQAAVEQDPDKLMDLIKQINLLLEEKERRLKGDPKGPDPQPAQGGVLPQNS